MTDIRTVVRQAAQGAADSNFLTHEDINRLADAVAVETLLWVAERHRQLSGGDTLQAVDEGLAALSVEEPK